MMSDKEISLLKKLHEIYDALVGDNGMVRYTHEEIIKYAYKLKDIEEKYYDSKN